MIQVLAFCFTEVLYHVRDYKLILLKDYLTGKVTFYHILFL